MKGSQKKITVSIPSQLLERAQDSTMTGITSTIIKGLELLAASQAFRELRGMRGKIKFSLDLKEMRKDR